MSNINWNKYFDQIYCIHYKPHEERFHDLNNELERVGILDSSIFQYLFTEEDNNKYFNMANKITINHNKCLVDAYDNNYNRILILENDIRFIKDLDILENQLENIPEDADLILFDYIFGYEFTEIDRLKELKKDNKDIYIDISGISRIFSAACYMCSRRMQKHLIDNYSRYQTTPDFFTCYQNVSVDIETDRILRRYVPSVNSAIQKVYDYNFRTVIHGNDNTYDRYEYQGLNLEDYNI